jgi:hypothetical protein
MIEPTCLLIDANTPEQFKGRYYCIPAGAVKSEFLEFPKLQKQALGCRR